MTPAQREILEDAVGEVTRPLLNRIAELEADLEDAQEQLAELEPMRPLLLALHKLIEGSDTAQYHAPSNTLHLGRATFAALGDETILRALRSAALDFTGETT